MGIFDSAQDLLNRGMAATERGTRMVSLKAQLGDAERQRDKALMAFGESVYRAAVEDPSLRVGREELFADVEAAYGLIADISHDILAVEDEGRAARAAAEQAKVEGRAEAPAEAVSEGRLYACPSCGADVEGGHKFCSSCGSSLTVAAPGPAVVPEPEPAPAAAPEPEPAPAAAPAYDPAPVSSAPAPREIAPERVTTVDDK